MRGGGLVERVLGADANLERTVPGEPGKGSQSRAVRPHQDAVHGEILVDGQVKVTGQRRDARRAATAADQRQAARDDIASGEVEQPSTLPTAAAICATGSPLVWSIVTSAPISRR